MTWPWLISSSLLAASLSAATVTGSVALVDSQQASVRSAKDFSGVVVWLEPVNANHTFPQTTTTRAQMLQKKKRFVPHILAVLAGTIVEFPNNDPIFHNAFSNFDGKVFDIGLYAPGTSRSVRLDRPGVVRVFCNIHPTMSALIAVLPTPYFAVSRPDGQYQIPHVPPGDYILRVVHERATPTVLQSLSTRLTVQEGTTTAQPISISESGYLSVTHKNKYGKEYPKTVDESFYPGAKK